MAGFARSVTIARPVEEVFALATNLERAGEWLPGIKKIEKLTDGPLRAGSQFRETRQMGKREATSVIEVTAHEPLKRHAARSVAMGVEGIYDYAFRPDGNGTRVDLTATVKGKGLGWLMAPVFSADMKKHDGDQLERLKRAAEAGAAPTEQAAEGQGQPRRD